MWKLVIAAGVGFLVLLVIFKSNTGGQDGVDTEEFEMLCPLVSRPMFRQECKNTCETHLECQQNQNSASMCCTNECLAKSCQAKKPGSCPVFSYDPQIMCDWIQPEFHECRLDAECPENFKCCPKGPCAYMTCEQERSGNCPKLSYDQANCPPFNEEDFTCRSDQLCRTPGQKCCRDKCFLLRCTDPV